MLNGLGRERLLHEKARRFRAGSCFWISDILKICPDYPIVAHGVKHDLNLVLAPAFKRFERTNLLPDVSRWKCTLNLCYKEPKIKYRGLDNVCSVLELPMRDPDGEHDALEDAKLAANVYMELMQRPEPKASALGLVESWEKTE